MRLVSAINFVKKLRPEHLQSFWYFASKSNLAIIGTFGSILWITSEDGEECENYKAQLSDYRWTLRISSQSANFMKHTVAMLDASTVFLRALDPKIGTPKGLLVSATTPQSTDGTDHRQIPGTTASPQLTKSESHETGDFRSQSTFGYGVSGGGGADPIPYDYGVVYNTVGSEQSQVSWDSSPQNMPTYATHPGSQWQQRSMPYQYQGFEHMPPHDQLEWTHEFDEPAIFNEF